MIYYKVKTKSDGYPRLIKRENKFGIDSPKDKYKKSEFKNDGYFVKGELYTYTEIKKYSNGFDNCDIVDIPKNKVYWFFGVRFCDTDI